ncbi:MAG: hypothetical protein U5L07_19435 [Desulfobacterales bacterium]|nr:hypothetical protein [Desulfobacterales bacterium]
MVESQNPVIRKNSVTYKTSFRNRNRNRNPNRMLRFRKGFRFRFRKSLFQTLKFIRQLCGDHRVVIIVFIGFPEIFQAEKGPGQRVAEGDGAVAGFGQCICSSVIPAYEKAGLRYLADALPLIRPTPGVIAAKFQPKFRFK